METTSRRLVSAASRQRRKSLSSAVKAALIQECRENWYLLHLGVHAEPALATHSALNSVTSPPSRKNSKNERLPVGISVIEQAKIQAQVLVPLVKALQAELGEERANSLVRTTLGDVYRRYGEEFRRTKNQNNLGTIMASAFATYAREDALDYRVIEQSQDAFEFDVVGCRYAEFYKELGEPELGFLLVCSADFPTAEGIDPDIELTRTQTIMQGASHCDFRYKRRK
jgi:L-2-amino-thiazoline-4-carboxylic acid hydrolase